jgi:methyl-accepting chemotaxis protein
MSLQKKLFGAFSLVAAICLLVGLTGWWGSSRLKEILFTTSLEKVPALEAVLSLSLALEAMKSTERTLLDATLSLAQRDAEYAALAKAREKADTTMANFSSFTHSPAELELWQEFTGQFAGWKSELDAFLELSHAFDANLISNPAQLALEAQQKLTAYQSWAIELSENIADAVELSVEQDPLKTEIGLWVLGLQTENSEVEEARKKVLAELEKVGGSMGSIKDFFAIEEVELAREVYAGEVKPTILAVTDAIRGMNIPIRMALANQHQMQEQALTVSAPLIERSQNLLAELVTRARSSMQENILRAETMVTRINALLWSSIAIGVVAAMGLGLIFTRSIVGPLAKTVDMIEALEKGHIDRRLNLERSDEIGRLGKAMDRFADSLQTEVVEPLQQLARGDLNFHVQAHDAQDQLRGAIEQLGNDLNGMIAQIQIAGQQINAGSMQVADASQTLSQGATESAASLEQISASMNEIGNQSRQSAEHAAQASRLSDEARSAADAGADSMQEMIVAMGEINQSGQSISKIIKVIDEIAFQTNLLALNAAVEAARAGQHGKGFAVVAEEVRNLAARSAKAAEETAELIEGSVHKATNGTRIAEKTAAELTQIVASITKVSDLVSEISAASTEQANGIGQVNQGLTQIDQVIQQNTASAEESAATSEELASQSSQMQQMLSRFTLKNQVQSGGNSWASVDAMTAPPYVPKAAIGWTDMKG